MNNIALRSTAATSSSSASIPSASIPSAAAPSARRGKVARLPASLRRQINLRLENNEPADSLLPWLNGLPETQQILAAHFDSAPITPQNLSEWRQGGFREWLLLQELMDHASRLDEGVAELSAQCAPERLADHLATVLAARYAALLNSWDGEVTPDFEAKIRLLRGLTRDVTQLQKSLHQSAQQNHDLARRRKEDADLDFVAAKKAAVDQVNSERRRHSLMRCCDYPHEQACAIVAIDNAASQAELTNIVTRLSSPQIRPNPTLSTLSGAASACETPSFRGSTRDEATL